QAAFLGIEQVAIAIGCQAELELRLTVAGNRLDGLGRRHPKRAGGTRRTQQRSLLQKGAARKRGRHDGGDLRKGVATAVIVAAAPARCNRVAYGRLVETSAKHRRFAAMLPNASALSSTSRPAHRPGSPPTSAGRIALARMQGAAIASAQLPATARPDASAEARSGRRRAVHTSRRPATRRSGHTHT